MVYELAEHIIDSIIALPDVDTNCDYLDYEPRYDNGYYLSYKDENKGVLYKDGREYKYTGINDRKGNHLYVRFRGEEEITWNPASSRTSCKSSVQGVAALRLISAIENCDQSTGQEKYSVETYLRNALLTIDWTSYSGDEKGIIINLVRSQINNIDILTEEGISEQRIKTHALRWIFTAVDFDLQFVYNPYNK